MGRRKGAGAGSAEVRADVRQLHEHAVDAAASAAELDELDEASGRPPPSAESGASEIQDDALPRTHLASEPETRFEELQTDEAALESLEPHDLSHSPRDVLCSSCHLWKASTQFADVPRRICHDCAT